MGTIDTLAVDDQVQALFLGYFDHGAMESELAHWDAMYDHIISAGQTPDEALHCIGNLLAEDPAAEALYPLLSAPVRHPASPAAHHRVADVVDQVWRDLFDHGPSAAKAAYWEHRVLSGAVPLSEMVVHIENHARGADAATLLHKIDSAEPYAATDMSSDGDGAVVADYSVGVTLTSAAVAIANPVTVQFADGSGEFGSGLLVAPNFVTGSAATATIVDFSVGASGLTGGTLAAGSVAAGADAAIGAQTAGSNVAADVTLVEITDQSFANASALATALEGSEHLIFSGVPAAGGASHVLVAYNDGTGSTRIANVGFMGSSPDTHFDTLTGTDMVQLLGVGATSLNAHNVHFLA
ncbi:MAG: hypothetical protein ABSE69_06890 [Roseiarcus sp.]